MSTDAEGRRVWTPNQVVAHNLRRARGEMTQDQAAKKLAPYVGSLWTQANFSAAERSVSGKRIRQFTADDLMALSLAFQRPVTYFLEPPEGVLVRVGGELVDVEPWLTSSVSTQDLVDFQRTLSHLAERLKPVIAAVIARSERGPTGISHEEAQAILGRGLLAPQEEQEERT